MCNVCRTCGLQGLAGRHVYLNIKLGDGEFTGASYGGDGGYESGHSVCSNLCDKCQREAEITGGRLTWLHNGGGEVLAKSLKVVKTLTFAHSLLLF